jgi:tetratricopeptide (TPR) repeat protein
MIMARKQPPTPPESILHWFERLLASADKGKEREAQELVYDSWDTADDDKAYDLLEQAVELDPTNVDGWLGLLDFEEMKEDERIEMLRRLIALGKENLGEKTFRECRGHFWGFIETRPYLRARAQLAQALMDRGRFDDAAAEYEGMLELNPGDNQGVRYEAMACYLAAGRLDDARRLFGEYEEREFCTFFAWSYVLERFLSGDLNEAAKGLRSAQRLNSHALAYFLGERKLPRTKPDSYSRGNWEEAVIAWNIMRHAWKRHPAAQDWLRAQKGRAKSR